MITPFAATGCAEGSGGLLQATRKEPEIVKAKYASFRLTADLRSLTANERKMIPVALGQSDGVPRWPEG